MLSFMGAIALSRAPFRAVKAISAVSTLYVRIDRHPNDDAL